MDHIPYTGQPPVLVQNQPTQGIERVIRDHIVQVKTVEKLRQRILPIHQPTTLFPLYETVFFSVKLRHVTYQGLQQIVERHNAFKFTKLIDHKCLMYLACLEKAKRLVGRHPLRKILSFTDQFPQVKILVVDMPKQSFQLHNAQHLARVCLQHRIGRVHLPPDRLAHLRRIITAPQVHRVIPVRHQRRHLPVTHVKHPLYDVLLNRVNGPLLCPLLNDRLDLLLRNPALCRGFYPEKLHQHVRAHTQKPHKRPRCPG